MSKLVWDRAGDRLYHTGVSHGVLYPIRSNGSYDSGVAWNGITNISENLSGAEPNAFYADDMKYLNILSAENYGVTISAYTYPENFKLCLGKAELAQGVTIGQQRRKHFGLTFRTLLGNDLLGDDFGYLIHLVYNCVASSSDEDHSTINDSPEPVEMSWEVTADTVAVEGYKPTAHVLLDSYQFNSNGFANVLKSIEDVLYGTDSLSAKLPTFEELNTLMDKAIHLQDSDGEFILDSSGNKIQSMVYG